jgi:hypothetical protein
MIAYLFWGFIDLIRMQPFHITLIYELRELSIFKVFAKETSLPIHQSGVEVKYKSKKKNPKNQSHWSCNK